MDLNTITAIQRPRSAAEFGPWQDGHAWLAGGTWLFSEPQIRCDTLIDLQGLDWPPLTVSAEGLEIAATCPIAELDRFAAPPDWAAGPLLRICCRSLLMSFKIANMATVGGNICMSLPAGAMISLTTALEATYTLWPREGEPRSVAAVDFVTGDHANVLAHGELLRSIHIPASALKRRFAFRRSSLTHLGRSAALVIGTRGADDLVLTVSAATPKPVQLRFPQWPSAEALRQAIDERIPDDGYFDDVHGTPSYRRHLTRYYAESILAELAGTGAGA